VAQPIIPGYTIAERIGSGGFASVYLATHDETGHDVAIKVLHDHTSNGADLLRFERERTTMRALNGHPNIVAILDAGTTDDERHFTVLEYVGGGSVRDRIAEGGALHWANVVEIGVQICAALDVAHRSGVLHRDVKPANILLEESTAKLGDFGIARLIGQSQVTAAQSIIGTLAYTPPEVFHNKPFDGRGDIYQLLLGRAPFTSAAADNKATIIRRILDNPAPPLAQFDVPLPLSNLLDEVLAKDPADRPQTAESFGRRLNEVEDALGRTPTSIGEPTESISIETTTLGNTSETGEHDVSVWPAGAEAVVVETTDAVPPLSTVVAAETPMGDRVAAAVAPDAPLAPEVDPPFDANVTVAEPRPADPTAVHASSGAAPMSLGTPGPAPAHFDEPPKRRTQDRPASAVKPKPRRWPLALLLVGLIGAGAAGVIAARLSDNNSGTEDDSSVETTTDDTSNDVVESAPQFAPLEDAAFLEPDVAQCRQK